MSDPPFQRPSLRNPLEEDPASAPPEPAGESSEIRSQPPRFRFSIKLMLLLMLVVAIGTAGYNGMRLGGERRIFALMFVGMAPFVLLAVLAVARQFLRRGRK